MFSYVGGIKDKEDICISNPYHVYGSITTVTDQEVNEKVYFEKTNKPILILISNEAGQLSYNLQQGKDCTISEAYNT